jgi:DNA polymerase-3 subunit epsilon
MLLSRRLYPDAPNHRLGTLADWHGLPKSGRAHRALADAEMTAHLLLRMQADLRERHAALLEESGGEPDHDALCALQRLSRREIARRAGGLSAAAASAP